MKTLIDKTTVLPIINLTKKTIAYRKDGGSVIFGKGIVMLASEWQALCNSMRAKDNNIVIVSVLEDAPLASDRRYVLYIGTMDYIGIAHDGPGLGLKGCIWTQGGSTAVNYSYSNTYQKTWKPTDCSKMIEFSWNGKNMLEELKSGNYVYIQ